jgi:fido (protein-threonine AMPylation protein)
VARASATLGEAEDDLRTTRQRLEEAEAAVTSLRAAEAEAVQRVTSARKEHRSALATQHKLARAAERLE